MRWAPVTQKRKKGSSYYNARNFYFYIVAMVNEFKKKDN